MLRTIEIISRFQSPQYCQLSNQPNLIFHKDSPKSWAQVALETWTRKIPEKLRIDNVQIPHRMSPSRGRFITDQRITHILTELAEVSAEVSGAECQIAVPLCCMNPSAVILSQALLTDIQHVQILLCEYVFVCLFVLFCFLFFFFFFFFFLSFPFCFSWVKTLTVAYAYSVQTNKASLHWFGPSHWMFSFLLQILKVWGGHFSLFIIHYFFQNQNMQYNYTIFVITHKHKAWYVLLDKNLCVGLLQMGIYIWAHMGISFLLR